MNTAFHKGLLRERKKPTKQKMTCRGARHCFPSPIYVTLTFDCAALGRNKRAGARVSSFQGKRKKVSARPTPHRLFLFRRSPPPPSQEPYTATGPRKSNRHETTCLDFISEQPFVYKLGLPCVLYTLAHRPLRGKRERAAAVIFYGPIPQLKLHLPKASLSAVIAFVYYVQLVGGTMYASFCRINVAC